MRTTRAYVSALVAACLMTAGLGIGIPAAQAATPSYLFTVQSVSGKTVAVTPVRGEDERFTLSLRGVDPVTKFADRPFRSASVMSPAALVSNWNAWFADSAPNAVLTYSRGAGVAPQSIVVTLSRPVYSSKSRTLSFDATRTYRVVDPSQKGKGWVRPVTPRTFVSASVFIDDADSSFTDSIVESMQWAIQQYAMAPNNSNTWDAVIASLSGLLTQAWEAGSLWSPTSNQPYSVVCQPTPIMIMQSTMACNVSMQLADGSTFTTTVTQSMMSG